MASRTEQRDRRLRPRPPRRHRASRSSARSRSARATRAAMTILGHVQRGGTPDGLRPRARHPLRRRRRSTPCATAPSGRWSRCTRPTSSGAARGSAARAQAARPGAVRDGRGVLRLSRLRIRRRMSRPLRPLLLICCCPLRSPAAPAPGVGEGAPSPATCCGSTPASPSTAGRTARPRHRAGPAAGPGRRRRPGGQVPSRAAPLDDADPESGTWDPGLVSANARKAAQDDKTIAYLGEMDTGASAVSIPILNETDILEVSPTDTVAGFTRRREPARASPTSTTRRATATSRASCRRDDVQAAGAAAPAAGREDRRARTWSRTASSTARSWAGTFGARGARAGVDIGQGPAVDLDSVGPRASCASEVAASGPTRSSTRAASTPIRRRSSRPSPPRRRS